MLDASPPDAYAAIIGNADPGEVVESERLARRYFAAVARGDFAAAVALMHPQVEYTLRTRPGEVLHGRERVERFLLETEDRFYEAAGEMYRPLDAERVVVEGRLRWADEERVLRDDPLVWALQFRDGLLLRSIPTQSVLEAESVLAALGDEEGPVSSS